MPTYQTDVEPFNGPTNGPSSNMGYQLKEVAAKIMHNGEQKLEDVFHAAIAKAKQEEHKIEEVAHNVGKAIQKGEHNIEEAFHQGEQKLKNAVSKVRADKQSIKEVADVEVSRIRRRKRNITIAIVLGFIIWLIIFIVWMQARPQDFSVSNVDEHAAVDGVYFFTTTLSSVGYGDICPKTPMAKIAVGIFQMYITAVSLGAVWAMTGGDGVSDKIKQMKDKVAHMFNQRDSDDALITQIEQSIQNSIKRGIPIPSSMIKILNDRIDQLIKENSPVPPKMDQLYKIAIQQNSDKTLIKQIEDLTSEGKPIPKNLQTELVKRVNANGRNSVPPKLQELYDSIFYKYDN